MVNKMARKIWGKKMISRIEKTSKEKKGDPEFFDVLARPGRGGENERKEDVDELTQNAKKKKRGKGVALPHGGSDGWAGLSVEKKEGGLF